MTLAELEWMKERFRLFGRPEPEPEPEREPEPMPEPEQTPSFDFYGELLVGAEVPTST